MKTGIEIIADERNRQIQEEGWTSSHDEQHKNEELARAAMCYAMPNDIKVRAVWGDNRMLRFYQNGGKDIELFPKGWKMNPTPDNRINELAKAGALIAAEIDRLQKLD